MNKTKLLLPMLACLFANTSFAKSIEFLVFGDMPYSQQEVEMLSKPNGELYQQVQKQNPDFFVHVGDMKASIQSCTDLLLKENYELIKSLSPAPFIFTPGDNDWTDCDREKLLEPMDELERLAFVRKEFTKETPKLPEFKRQSVMAENQAWKIDGVQFITLHAVATNNGRKQIYLSDETKALDLVDERDANNFAWLESLPTTGLKAAVIFTQADVFVEAKKPKNCSKDKRKKCDGLLAYREKLDAFAKRADFPVLLVHGDTPDFCFSKRSSGLWHLNGPGDGRVKDIAKVTLDLDTKTPFKVEALLGSPLKTCADVSNDE